MVFYAGQGPHRAARRTGYRPIRLPSGTVEPESARTGFGPGRNRRCACRSVWAFRQPDDLARLRGPRTRSAQANPAPFAGRASCLATRGCVVATIRRTRLSPSQHRGSRNYYSNPMCRNGLQRSRRNPAHAGGMTGRQSDEDVVGGEGRNPAHAGGMTVLPREVPRERYVAQPRTCGRDDRRPRRACRIDHRARNPAHAGGMTGLVQLCDDRQVEGATPHMRAG